MLPLIAVCETEWFCVVYFQRWEAVFAIGFRQGFGLIDNRFADNFVDGGGPFVSESHAAIP